jgi:hypothetical protein
LLLRPGHQSYRQYEVHIAKPQHFRIAVGVGDVVEGAASFITWVRLVSPIGGDTGGNMSTGLSNVARLAANPKFMWFSTPTEMRQSFIITLYYKYIK